MIDTMRLAGKIALVTGAASGIGKAVVAAFKAEGAQVIAADIEYADGEPRDGSIANSVRLDASNEAAWERLAARFPRFDLLAALRWYVRGEGAYRDQPRRLAAGHERESEWGIPVSRR